MIQTIEELVRRHTAQAAHVSFTLSSPVSPIGLSLSCVQLGEAQLRIEQAVREAFYAGAVYGMSQAARTVTVVAPDDTQHLAPVRGPYPPPLRRRLNGG